MGTLDAATARLPAGSWAAPDIKPEPLLTGEQRGTLGASLTPRDAAALQHSPRQRHLDPARQFLAMLKQKLYIIGYIIGKRNLTCSPPERKRQSLAVSLQFARGHAAWGKAAEFIVRQLQCACPSAAIGRQMLINTVFLMQRWSDCAQEASGALGTDERVWAD